MLSMVKSLESMSNTKLKHLVSEIMARDGYSIKLDPMFYPEIDLIATSANKKDIEKYYVVVAGRTTSEYLTKRDIQGCLPDPMNLSDSSQLLVVTNCRSSSKKAREVAHNDPTNKSVWYLKNLLSKIRDVDSEYLIRLYDDSKYRYDELDSLESRMGYQDIHLSSECLQYITSYTYHPRKIVAHIELNEMGKPTNLDNMPAVKKFSSEFG